MLQCGKVYIVVCALNKCDDLSTLVGSSALKNLCGVKNPLPLNFSPVGRASSGGSVTVELNTPKGESTLTDPLLWWLYIAKCGYHELW